jgi:hypothetical protein
MLDLGQYGNVSQSYWSVIRILGVPLVYIQTKPPQTTLNIIGGWKIAGTNDAEIIQAYGIGVRVITCDARDFTTQPEKFDKFIVNGESFSCLAVHPVHLNASLVGYKCYCKGK